MGVVLGAAGPVLASTSPEEQRRSRIRVRLKGYKNWSSSVFGTESKRIIFLGEEE